MEALGVTNNTCARLFNQQGPTGTGKTQIIKSASRHLPNQAGRKQTHTSSSERLSLNQQGNMSHILQQMDANETRVQPKDLELGTLARGQMLSTVGKKKTSEGNVGNKPERQKHRGGNRSPQPLFGGPGPKGGSEVT